PSPGGSRPSPCPRRTCPLWPSLRASAACSSRRTCRSKGIAWSFPLPVLSSKLVLAELLLLRVDLSTKALLLFADLSRRADGSEVGALEDLPDLDLAVLGVRVGAALDPLDRFRERLALPQPEAGDQFLGLGKRPVDDSALGALEADAGALGARLQPLA